MTASTVIAFTKASADLDHTGDAALRGYALWLSLWPFDLYAGANTFLGLYRANSFATKKNIYTYIYIYVIVCVVNAITPHC